MPNTPPSDEIYRAIIENLADGVYYVDPDRRIEYWNRGAESISGYGPTEVVGHRCFENILDHVDAAGNQLCHTACPLAATIADGETREASLWLRHRDGYRKPVRIRTMPVRDASGSIIGGVETFSDESTVLRAMEDADRVRRDSLTDELTGLPNRRLFDTALQGRLENLNRYGWQFGLLLIDIDVFKAVNDAYGHAFGDTVLIGISRTLQGAVRAGDVLARWGGDEFAVLVEASDNAGLRDAGERIRVLVAQSEIRRAGLLHTTRVSVGGALARKDDSAESLFGRTDAALYTAKRNGRNRYEVAE
ncbi:MAG: diguanylate cyclase domain-containing protein [Candidatus Limnocylindrales bacterium]